MYLAFLTLASLRSAQMNSGNELLRLVWSQQFSSGTHQKKDGLSTACSELWRISLWCEHHPTLIWPKCSVDAANQPPQPVHVFSAWHDIVHEVSPLSALQGAILLDYLCLTYGQYDCSKSTKSAGPFGITKYILLTDVGSLDLLPVWNQTKHGAPSHQVVRSKQTVGVKTFDVALVKARWE